MTSQVVAPKAAAPVVAVKKENYNIYRTPSGQVPFFIIYFNYDSFIPKSFIVLPISFCFPCKMGYLFSN